MSGKKKPKRVRLRKGFSQKAIDAMQKGREESFKNAPRMPNGKIVPGYKYKSLLEGHQELGRKPRVYTGKSLHSSPKFVVHPGIKRKIVKLIRKGYPYTTVCRYVGVTPSTFKDWLEKGKLGVSKEYVDFYQAVARSEADAEMRLLKAMQLHERSDWRVSAWQLERRWPEHWAKQDRVTAEMKVHTTVESANKEKLGKSVLTDEVARDLARRMIDHEMQEYENHLEDHSDENEEV